MHSALKAVSVIYFIFLTSSVITVAKAQAPVQVADILTNFNSITEYQGMLYFTARPDDEFNAQLYQSDGTKAVTQVLKEISSNSVYWMGASPNDLIVVNDLLIYEQYDSTHTVKKLWKTDGTSAGTSIIKHFDSNNIYCLYENFVLNNQLIFVVDTEDYGYELWKTDGTEA